MNILNLTQQELLDLQKKIQAMNPVDLADYIEELEPDEKAVCIKLLDKELLAETFAELSPRNKEELITVLTAGQIADIFVELDADEVVDTIQELPANMVNKLIKYVSDDRRPFVNQLLGYPQESVGSIMSIDYVKAKTTRTKSEVLDFVYESDIDAENLEVIWMVDQKLKLVGFIYLADLVRLKGESLEDIINPIVASVTTLDDQEMAAKVINRYHLEALPVVDLEGRLVGSIITEMILDVMTEEFQEDIYNLQGMAPTEESYLDTPIFSIAKKRFSWLLILMFTATITSKLIQGYEAVLAGSVALIAYIPMLMDTGGNSGNQATATIIQSLALNEIEGKDFLKVIGKEAGIGLMIGGVMAVFNFARVMLMDGVTIEVACTVSLALTVTIVVAKVIGGVLPLLAVKLKQDPTVMAGPLLTTIVDTIALTVFFEFAKIILGL